MKEHYHKKKVNIIKRLDNFILHFESVSVWFAQHQLLRLTVFLILGSIAFQYLPSFDKFMLFYIGGTYALCIVIMLIYTRRWNTIGVGLLTTMLGNAILYLLVALSSVYAYNILAQHAYLVNFIRSGFVVGATYLVVGVLEWVRDDKRLREEAERLIAQSKVAQGGTQLPTSEAAAKIADDTTNGTPAPEPKP